jgi:chromate transporter
VKQLWDLAGVFAYLSLLTIGGGMAAFPEMKELTVDTYHWVTFPELLHFYSLGQLAPGPNMMMVASIGVTVAHIPGALVALVAFFLPTGLLTFFVGRLWTHLATWRWRPAIQTGLGSVAVGLVLAGAIIMGKGAITQVFFRAEDYARLRDRSAVHGCTMPIVPGLMPVTNVSQIERFAALSGAQFPQELAARFHAIADDSDAVRALGVEVATEMAQELLDMGAPGIHFYTLNRSTSTRQVYEALGLGAHAK